MESVHMLISPIKHSLALNVFNPELQLNQEGNLVFMR